MVITYSGAAAAVQSDCLRASFPLRGVPDRGTRTIRWCTLAVGYAAVNILFDTICDTSAGVAGR